MRIHSFQIKVLYWVIAVIVEVVVGVAIAEVGSTFANAVECILFLGSIVIASRTFRGDGEGDAPRPWWKMTATPGVGYFFSGWWVLSVAAYCVQGAFEGDVQWMTVTVQLLVGLCLALSSTRLRLLARADRVTEGLGAADRMSRPAPEAPGR